LQGKDGHFFLDIIAAMGHQSIRDWFTPFSLTLGERDGVLGDLVTESGVVTFVS